MSNLNQFSGPAQHLITRQTQDSTMPRITLPDIDRELDLMANRAALKAGLKNALATRDTELKHALANRDAEWEGILAKRNAEVKVCLAEMEASADALLAAVVEAEKERDEARAMLKACEARERIAAEGRAKTLQWEVEKARMGFEEVEVESTDSESESEDEYEYDDEDEEGDPHVYEEYGDVYNGSDYDDEEEDDGGEEEDEGKDEWDVL